MQPRQYAPVPRLDLAGRGRAREPSVHLSAGRVGSAGRSSPWQGVMQTASGCGISHITKNESSRLRDELFLTASKSNIGILKYWSRKYFSTILGYYHYVYNGFHGMQYLLGIASVVKSCYSAVGQPNEQRMFDSRPSILTSGFFL